MKRGAIRELRAEMTGLRELVMAKFDASEKAIVKAEEAQKSYNQTHNDLARKMDDQSKATMPRPETEQRFHGVEEKISNLRDLMTAGGGAVQGGKAVKDESRANMALILAGCGGLVGLIGLLVVLWRVFTGH